MSFFTAPVNPCIHQFQSDGWLARLQKPTVPGGNNPVALSGMRLSHKCRPRDSEGRYDSTPRGVAYLVKRPRSFTGDFASTFAYSYKHKY